jgi:flagellin-like protein
MRGISAIIAVVLILLITISLAAGAYLFLSATMSQTTTAAQQGISQTMTQMTKSFTIEAVDGPRISIRNTGQAQLSNFSVYVDNSLVNTSQVSIAPDEVKTILIYDFVDFSRSREVKVVSGSVAQMKIVSKQDPSLVGYWKFDEGSGSIAYDSSGNGNDGTLLDGNLSNADGNTPPRWTNGTFGGALKFDGLDDYVVIPNSSVFNLDTFTIEAWVRVDKYAGNIDILLKGWNILRFFINNQHKFGVVVQMDGTGGQFYHPTLINEGQWYHLAAVVQSGKQAVYVNGAESIQGTYTYTSLLKNAANPLIISAYNSPTPTSFSNATIDEVRIYNRALSADEIWNHYVHGPV